MNVALALPWAESPEDVAGFSGRITTSVEGRGMVPGHPAFGASSHMAGVVLAARRVNPQIYCAANVRMNEATMAALDKCGFAAIWFDHALEPAGIKVWEGSSLEWGTFKALSEHPDPQTVAAVCDKGEKGKEPMIRILAGSMDELFERLAHMAAALG
jgi:hydroxymethylpyrimidine/phosphomethylpyrimidine kinase